MSSCRSRVERRIPPRFPHRRRHRPEDKPLEQRALPRLGGKPHHVLHSRTREDRLVDLDITLVPVGLVLAAAQGDAAGDDQRRRDRVGAFRDPHLAVEPQAGQQSTALWMLRQRPAAERGSEIGQVVHDPVHQLRLIQKPIQETGGAEQAARVPPSPTTPSSAFSLFTCSLQSWLLSFANRGHRGLKAAKPVGPDGPTQPEPTPKKITRFHGTVAIDPLRAGTIAREVIKHLSGLVSVKVQLTMEIQAEVLEGIPEERQRIVNENCRTLKFQSFRFEEE